MKLTSKSHHAIVAMIHLALHDHEGPVTLVDIAQNMNISMSYLEQLFSGLRVAGLIAGVRGPGGGYSLGHRADQINIAEIVRAVEGDIVDARYVAGIQMPTDRMPTSQQLWDELCGQLEDFLEGLTLADVTGQKTMSIAPRNKDSFSSHIHAMFPARTAMAVVSH